MTRACAYRWIGGTVLYIALLLALSTCAHAQPDRLAQYGTTARDVVHAKRNAPPFGRRKAREWQSGREGLRTLGRPAAWCGWWLGRELGMPDRRLWLARNWKDVGHSAGGPAVGAVVVWPHHVGIITGRAPGGWVVKSGDDGHRVRERVRSVSGAIAFRRV